MLKCDIEPGTEYALREKRAPGTPFQRVRIIEHVRGNKWKAKWIDPNSGLVDYVESGQLIVPWKEHKAFLRDEENAERLWQYNSKGQGFKENSPIASAVLQVFESTGERVDFVYGSLRGSPDAIGRIKGRAGMNPGQHSPVSYVDRHGTLYLPFDETFQLARKLCAAEPSTVLVGVETTERDWERKARRGEDYVVTLLNEYRASWAILRQWAGHDAAVAQREDEIKRLERLVWDAIYALQKARLEKEADKLRRAIEGR